MIYLESICTKRVTLFEFPTVNNKKCGNFPHFKRKETSDTYFYFILFLNEPTWIESEIKPINELIFVTLFS